MQFDFDTEVDKTGISSTKWETVKLDGEDGFHRSCPC
jgi:hypothetical protein